MFAIYNNGTVGFRSTSDNLYNLKTIEEIEPIRFEPKEGLIQDFSSQLSQEQKKEFINSYKKIAQLDTLEPVYKISDIMTQDVFHVTKDSTIEEIYYFLKEKKYLKFQLQILVKRLLEL